MPQLSLTRLGTLSAWLGSAWLNSGNFSSNSSLINGVVFICVCTHFAKKSCKINRHCINQFYNVNLLENYPQFTWLVAAHDDSKILTCQNLTFQNHELEMGHDKTCEDSTTIPNTSQLIWPICQNRPKHLG